MTRQFQPQEHLGTSRRPEMQRAAQPPNHDGMDLSQLPPVHEALLSAEQVEALLADLEQHADDVQLMARSKASGGGDQSGRLNQVGRMLLSGEITKAQVRYQWRGARWIDTLETQASGFRLVRIRHLPR